MLDPELTAFIASQIRSIWALELLLLLRKQAGRQFTAQELAQALRATESLVISCLAQLSSAGLLQHSEDSWRYAPTSAQVDDLAARLETAYAEKPVQVVNAIVAAPNARLQTFADAFRVGRKED